jgi:hypothetical protein
MIMKINTTCKTAVLIIFANKCMNHNEAFTLSNKYKALETAIQSI